MREILVINPRRKKTRTKKPATKRRVTKKPSAAQRRRTIKRPARRTLSARSKGGTMAQKPKKRRTPTKTIVRTIRKRRAPARRNPSNTRAAARKAGGALKGLLSAKNLTDSAKQTGGMLATQFFAKRFAEGGGANDPNWTWQNYAWGSAGALLSGLAAEMVKSGSGKEFFKGGMSLLMYKLVVNELSQKSAFVSEYFGAPEYQQNNDVFQGADGNTYIPGDTYLGDDGEVYLMGNEGEWLPTGAAANTYIGPESALGEAIMPPSSLGGEISPPTAALGGVDPYVRAFS